MNDVFDKKVVERNGKKYLVKCVYDYDSKVSEVLPGAATNILRWAKSTKKKRPGERCIKTRSGVLFFDFASQVKNYRSEGSLGIDAARYALQDYERVCDYYLERWSYIGIVVAPYCWHCDQPNETKSASIWGIESDSDVEYFEQVISELIAEVDYEQKQPSATIVG